MNTTRISHVGHALLELVRPSPVLSSDTLELLSHERAWASLCRLIAPFGLGALIYERCRTQPVPVPGSVLEWLKAQHDRTASRNANLLDELTHLLSTLSTHGIPALVLKGPVLGHLGIGLLIRPFHDLDVLVRHRDLDAVFAIMRSQGFVEAGGVSHPFHRIFVRPAPGWPTIVEVHFHLGDPKGPYTPDISGLWDRSMQLNLDGRAVPTLSLGDHLLVTMMQLPHHHWNLRLLIDIGTIVNRWTDLTDWDVVVERAKGWGMRALAGSTLYAVGWWLRVTLPAAFTRLAYPETYWRRIQWHVVRHAVRDQFEAAQPKTCRLASILLSDRFFDLVPLMGRKALLADLPNGHRQTLSAGLRRVTAAASTLPLLLWLFTEAAVTRPSNDSGFAGTGEVSEHRNPR